MFTARIENIRKKLIEEKLDAVLISSVSSISFLTGFTNFSKDEREAYIFIGKNFQYIITDGRYSEAIKKQVSHLELFQRGGGRSTEELFLKHKNEIKILGVEEDNLTVIEHKQIKKHFKKINHFNASHTRKFKTSDEIKKLQKACQISDQAYKFILKQIKTGVSEKQITIKLENFIKQNNAEFSFPAIVAFGEHSAIPHHQTGDFKLGKKQGQFILLDFGARFENYCSDMTRTVFFGKPSKEQERMYKTVLTAQTKAVEYVNLKIKSNKRVFASEVDAVARDYILSQGYDSIPHSLGHGIGIDVHESPSLSPKNKEELKEGMVFSIEPGIYLPKIGGVRIEDLYVFEKTKLKQITTSPILPI